MAKINEAMSKIMEVLDVLSKDRISQPGTEKAYSYRSIDELLNKLHPALVANKVIIAAGLDSPAILEYREGRGNCFRAAVSVKFVFTSLEDGSSFVVGPFVGEGCDSGDKAANKAHTAAFKNAMYQTFCVPVEGASTDSENGQQDKLEQKKPQPKPQAQPASTPPPAKPISEIDDQKHKAELTGILMQLGRGDPEMEKVLLYSWTKFTATRKTQTNKIGDEVFINTIDDKRLKGKWLAASLDRARADLALPENQSQRQTPSADDDIPY